MFLPSLTDFWALLEIILLEVAFTFFGIDSLFEFKTFLNLVGGYLIQYLFHTMKVYCFDFLYECSVKVYKLLELSELPFSDTAMRDKWKKKRVRRLKKKRRKMRERSK